MLAALASTHVVIAWVPFRLDPPARVAAAPERLDDGTLALGGRRVAAAGVPPWGGAGPGATGAVTVHLEVRAAREQQTGPARILTISDGFHDANLMIGQEREHLVVRVRREGSDEAGSPGALVRRAFTGGGWRDVRVDVRPGGVTVEVGGRPVQRLDAGPAPLGTWDPGYPLLLGDERGGGRVWHGDVRRAVVEAGGTAVDYVAPGSLEVRERAWYVPARLHEALGVPDARARLRGVLHLLAFLPVGAALTLVARRPPRGPGQLARAVAAAAAFGAMLQFGKVFLDGRHPSVLTVLLQAAGALAGAALVLHAGRARRRGAAGVTRGRDGYTHGHMSTAGSRTGAGEAAGTGARATPAATSGGAGTYRTRTVRALGHAFVVETDDAALTAYLDHLFAAMADPAPQPARAPAAGHAGAGGQPGGDVWHYTLVEQRGDAGARWELLAGGRLVVRTSEPPTALAMLLWDVNRSVVERTDGLLLLHAAAAERDGVAVVLPGAMEAGKTTMVAALLRAGLRYLTDEVTAVDVSAGAIRPYPKALSVDPGSWPLLAELEPAPPTGVRRFLPDQWQVVPSDIRPDALSPGARPGLFVLPRYEPGAATRLRRLSRADALVALAGCAFGFEHDPAGTVGGLARLLGACETYELVHGDLDEAVREVLDLLAAATAPPGEGPPPAADTPGWRGLPASPAAARPHGGGASMARRIDPEEIGLDFAPRRHGGTTGVELDGEMVLYSGEGAMHKLDPVATVLWHCFDGSVTLSDLVGDLDSVYEGTSAERIAEDVLACVRELGRQGLLENVTPPAAGADGSP